MKKFNLVFVFLFILLFIDYAMTKEINEHLEKGQYCFRSGQLNQALVEAKLAVKEEPDNPDGYFLLANIYLIKKDVENTILYAEKVRKINPHYKGYNIVLGSACLLKGEYDNAIKAYEKELEIEGPNSDIYVMLGCAYYEKKDMENAKKYLQLALEKDPNNQLASAVLLKIKNKKEFSDSIKFEMIDEESWSRVMEQRRNQHFRSDDYFNNLKERYAKGEANENDACILGLQYFYRGLQKDALECFSKILSDNPENIMAINCIGILSVANKNFKKAVESFNKAIEIKDTAESHIYLSNCYKIMGESELASLELEKAMMLDPERISIYEELLELYSDRKMFDRGFEISKKLIKIAPDSAKANYFLGYFYYNKKDFEKGLEYSKKAITLDPKMADAYCTLGVIYLEQEELEKGINQLKKALAIDPDNVNAHSLLGTIYAKTGKKDLAIKEFKEVIALRPNTISILHFLALLYLDNRDIDKSIEMCKRIIEINPDHEEAHLFLARLFIIKKSPMAAIVELNKVLEINPNNYIAYYNFACVYAAQGNVQKTISELQKAIDLGFSDINAITKGRYFDHLQEDKEFKEFVSKLKKKG